MIFIWFEAELVQAERGIPEQAEYDQVRVAKSLHLPSGQGKVALGWKIRVLRERPKLVSSPARLAKGWE